MTITWDKDLKQIFRPEDLHMGKMTVDPEKCTGCGLCIQNCLFRTWEMGENNVPRYKENWACFSCYNCMVACPTGAISIVEPYYVGSGFWKSQPHKLPPVYPLEPRDANGNPDQWNEVEKVIFTRRTVRNFSDKPVPEPLIRRVLEAGRAAPSGGNSQPWKFIVITDKALIEELNEASSTLISAAYQAYADEERVKEIAAAFPVNSPPGGWDPRIILGGMGTAVVGKVNKVLLGAPVVILVAADTRAIGGPQMQVGICGTNMNLVANSLGLKATWIGFVATCNARPDIMKKLGIEFPFVIITSMVLGYPKFKQEGVVPREYRPITWFREGSDGPEVEEAPPIPEVKK